MSNSEEDKQLEITILGSGLAGSLLSILLAQQGHTVSVYEKRSDPRREAAVGGRSINLALSYRGWQALAAAGLRDAVAQQAMAMRGRMMHSTDGELTFQPYGTEDQAIYSVSRGGLNRLLLNEAEHQGVRLFFEHTGESVDLSEGVPTVANTRGDTLRPEADLLVGADGAYSALRRAMQVTPRFNYSQHYIEHGYKELHIPPTADGDFALEPHALHIWPRGGFMLIALPNPDKSFTATLFLAYEGGKSFAKLADEAAVMPFFEEQFPDAVPLMPELTEDFFRNPTSDLVTIRCEPWVRGRCVLLGDAAHAIVPFYGQGMNAAFEDCRIFSELLAEQPNIDITLRTFQQQRKPDADAIAELALQNFVEMRDRVADPSFLAQKQIEAELHRRYPDRWIPQYTQVTFSGVRYSEALRRGKQQHAIMQEVMKDHPDSAMLTDRDYERIIGRLPT